MGIISQDNITEVHFKILSKLYQYVNYINCFQKWLLHFTFSPAVHKSSTFSTSLSTLGIVCPLCYRHSSKCVVVIYVLVDKMSYFAEKVFRDK